MRKILSIIFSKAMGIVFFVLILFALNMIEPFFDSRVLTAFVSFFNEHLSYILIMSIVIAIAEIFFVFTFPFNLLAPLVSAFGAVLLVRFIFRMLGMVENVLSINILYVFSFFSGLIYTIVFLITLISGYVSLIPKHDRKKENMAKENMTRTKKESRQKSAKSWSDLGDEFRETLSDLLVFIRKKLK